MAEVKHSLIQRANTTTGTPTALWTADPNANTAATKFYVDVRNTSTMSVYVAVTGGATNPTWTFEVTADPAPSSSTIWQAAAVRQPGGGAYSATAITQTTAGATYFFDPTDNVCFIRMNQTAGDKTITATLTQEV